jgi:hypothetical protein
MAIGGLGARGWRPRVHVDTGGDPNLTHTHTQQAMSSSERDDTPTMAAAAEDGGPGEGEDGRATVAGEGQGGDPASPPHGAPDSSPEALAARLDRMEQLQNRSMSALIPILTRAVDSMRVDAGIRESSGRAGRGRQSADGTVGHAEPAEEPFISPPSARGRVTDARPGSVGARSRDRREELFRLSSVPLGETPMHIQEPEVLEPRATAGAQGPAGPAAGGASRVEHVGDVLLPAGPPGFNLRVRSATQAQQTSEERGMGADDDSDYQRDHPRLRARMGEHYGRPTCAGVRAIMGYGPRSEGSLPSRQLGAAPREPEQGKSLSLKESELEMFTGVVGVAKGVDTALTISGCPITFLNRATERLMERRIDPSRWVAAIINRLSPDVRTRFREHFSDRAEARAWTMIPFAMVHRRTHPADSADWEDFWRWLLRTYLRPAHQDAAHRRWQAMEHHRSTATSLMADTAAFNEALLHADLMEHVLRRNEVWLESPEIADTYERRRVYRAMLPEDIQLHVTQQEAHAARQVANEARQTAAEGDQRSMWMSSTLVGEGQAHAPEFTLDELQNVAVSFALVLERDAVRAQTQRLARLNFMQSAEDATPGPSTAPAGEDVRLHALEAQVHGLQLDAEAGDTDQALLFNIAAQHLPSPPSSALIQQRRDAGQCLACGESTTHSRFTECPQVRGNPALVETLRAFLRRHNADRRARGWSRSTTEGPRRPVPAPADGSRAPPPPARLSEQVHHLIDQLHHLAALVDAGGKREDSESDGEAGSCIDDREGDTHGKNSSRRDRPPDGARS